MTQMTRKNFLLLGFSARASTGASDGPASGRSDFSGRWVADMEKSDFASLLKSASLVRVIDQGHLHLTIAVEAVDQHGRKQSGALRFELDGEESVNEVGGVEVVGFARRLGLHMLVHTSRTMEGASFSVDELWTLSGDALTMTVEGSVRTSIGDEDLLVVLHKDRR